MTRIYQQRRANGVNLEEEFGYAPQVLEALVKLGVRIKAGSYINEADVKLLAAAHPRTPMEEVVSRVRMVNMTPPENRFGAFITYATSGGAGAVEHSSALVDSYDKFEQVIKVEDRLEARTVDTDRAKGRLTPEALKQQNTAIVAANKTRDNPNSVRANIEKAAGLRREVNPALLEDRAREVAADRLESSAAVLYRAKNQTFDLPGDRREVISAAFDATEAIEVGKEFGVFDENETVARAE